MNQLIIKSIKNIIKQLAEKIDNIRQKAG